MGKKKLNEKTKVNTQETSPKVTYMGDDTMFSTTSGSRTWEDLSTTGHLGDTEGLDSTNVQADLEYEDELTSSEVPWPQQPEPKKIRLSNETIVVNENTDAMETAENEAQAFIAETSKEENQEETSRTGTIPKKKTLNKETLELETQKEAMATENKILREQNENQLEQHQMMIEALNRNMNERKNGNRKEMERQVQELRHLLAQATEGRRQK